jgi:hypothetical protein
MPGLPIGASISGFLPYVKYVTIKPSCDNFEARGKILAAYGRKSRPLGDHRRSDLSSAEWLVRHKSAWTNNPASVRHKSRSITGEEPTIDLVLGYHKENNSPFLKLFLSRVDDLIAHMSKKSLAAGDCTLAAFRERCVCSLPSSSVFQVP